MDINNYVNRDWFKQFYSKSCPGWRHACGKTFTFEITDYVRGRRKGNLTADRQDDSLGHNIVNIKPLCATCNCDKSNFGSLQL